MKAKRVFFLLVIFIISGALLAAEEPKYHSISAEKIRLREGCPNVIQKLKAGQAVRLAYLGGSITAQNGWRVQSLAWFQKEFPKASVSEINAAIGGTGSDLGVYRIGDDVLRHNPDLVFVEFAVNDGGAPPTSIWRNMEGIVRQIWRHNSKTDIMFVYTFRVGYEKEVLVGNCPQSASAMEILADFYGIPSVNFMVPTVQLAKEEKLVYQSETQPEVGKIWFSTDGVHPRPEGHEVYTATLADAFTQLIKKNSPSVDYASKLNSVFVANNHEKAQMVTITPDMLSGTWSKMDKSNHLFGFSNRFGENIYTSGTPGSKLSFKFKGSAVKIYDLLGPNGGQVWVTLDGVKGTRPIARFDSYCTYHRLATLFVASDIDPDTIHNVTIEIDDKQPNRQPVAFRLQNPEQELKQSKYQGTNVWFGKILLLGDIVK